MLSDSEEDVHLTPPKKIIKNPTKHRAQKFRSEWLRVENLKKWFFDSKSGKIESKFWDLYKVYDSKNPGNATAEKLFNSLMESLTLYCIPKCNVIGFGSDGCNTMMGENNSVASRMKIEFPGIFIMKCVCHSAHLCASEACKRLPRSCEDLARNIFNYLKSSSKRQCEFSQFQTFLNLDPHKILHPSQTRWLSLTAVVDRVIEQWDALRLYFLDTVLVQRLLTALININPMNGQYQITDNELYLGTKVLMHKDNPDILSNNNQRKDFFERCRQFLQTSSLEMKKRYNMADPVLTELFSFKPKNALSLEFRNTKPSLVNLIKLVPCIININDPRIQVIDDEWRRLPISISSLPDDIENMIEPDTFWWSIKKFSIENDTQEFIQLCNFALALLSLPHANADCERIFSSVNCMKTKIRSKLITETISGLLHAKQCIKGGSKSQNNCTNFEPTNAMLSRMTANSLYCKGEESLSDSNVEPTYQVSEMDYDEIVIGARSRVSHPKRKLANTINIGNHRGGSRRSTNNKPAQGVTLMKLKHRDGTTPADKGPQRPEPKSPTSSDNESSIASKTLTHSSTTIGSNNSWDGSEQETKHNHSGPDLTTHYPDNPNHNADIMDVSILRTGKLRYALENLTAELSSDHTPIILELQAQGTQTLPLKPFKHTDWIKFNLDTKNIIFDLKKMQTTEQVDQAITELTTKIATLVNNNTHVTDPKDQTHNLPINILNTIHIKRKLRKNWRRTRNPNVKTLLNKQTTLVHELMHSHRDNEWVNFLSNIDSTSEGWSKIYKLNKKLMHKRPAVHPLSDTQNTLHYDAIAKSEIFADSMEKQFQTSDYTTQTDELVKNAIEEHFKLPHIKNLFFSPGEIQYTISKLLCQKAPGPDQLTNVSLKHCDRKVLLQLLNYVTY
ncbi:hypothetical protein ACI65C_009104 [Semiaphis heraclei]